MKIEFKVLTIAIIITLIGSILFAALIPLSSSLLYGWLFGAFASMFAYYLGTLLYDTSFGHRRKSSGFFMASGKSLVTMINHLGFIIILISIDKYMSGYNLIDPMSPVDVMYGPLNLFTYLGGVTIIMISSIVVRAFKQK